MTIIYKLKRMYTLSMEDMYIYIYVLTWLIGIRVQYLYLDPHGGRMGQVAPNVSSGILCAAWQQLQVQTLLMRKQQRAMEELKQVLEVRGMGWLRMM